MKNCIQCQCEMIDGFDIMVERGVYGIEISKGTGILAKRLAKPKVAICPECGDISLYIENIDEILENEK